MPDAAPAAPALPISHRRPGRDPGLRPLVPLRPPSGVLPPGVLPPAVVASGGPAARATPGVGPADRRSAYDQLRFPASPRPAVDPGLAGGLRAWLEDGVAALGDSDRLDLPPVVVGRPATIGPPGSAGQTQKGAAGRPDADVDRARRALVRAVFRLAVTSGPADRPFEDALAALWVDDDGRAVVEGVGRMDRSRRAGLRREVQRHADHVHAQWPPAPAAWLPRTADRLSVPLAGGRVVLAATAGLVLGAPSTGSASVCLVQLRHGAPHEVHRRDRAFLALLETVRSGAPPFRVATFYTGCGRLDVDDVGDSMLGAAVTEALEATASVLATAPVTAPTTDGCRRAVTGAAERP